MRVIHYISLAMALFICSGCWGEAFSYSSADEKALVDIICTSKDDEKRNEALNELCLRVSNDEFVDRKALLKCLSEIIRIDENDQINIRALNLLGLLRETPLEMKEVLVQLTENDNVELRSLALVALVKIGTSEDIVSAVVAMLNDPEPGIRYSALVYLGGMAEMASQHVDSIVNLIDDNAETMSGEVRYACIITLGYISKYNDEAATPLIEIVVNDMDPFGREHAALALGNSIPGEEIVDALIIALSDEVAAVRRFAAQSLNTIGKYANKAIPKLEDVAANDSNYDVRIAAGVAVGNIKDEE